MMSPRSEHGPKEVVLYRCTAPTNYLCPCGTVARRLKKRGIDFRSERVSKRRSERPEITALTGQEFVPVIVDGDQVMWNSERILQYLDER
jgi:glutathione S-transferase